jgi:integrase
MPRTRSGAHLVKRGDTFTARRKVPRDLVDTIGASDLKAALGTTKRRDAERMAGAWSERVDAGMTALRTGLVSDVDDPRSWLRDFAARALDELQEQVDEQLAETTSLDRSGEVAEAYDAVELVLAEPVDNGEDWAIRDAIKLTGEDPDAIPPELRQRMAVLAIKALRNLDFNPNRLPHPVVRPVSGSPLVSPSASLKPSKGIAVIFDEYRKVKIAAREWHPKQQEISQLQGLLDFVGAETPLAAITTVRLFEWTETIRGRGHSDATAATATKNGRLGTANAFFGWAVEQGYVDRNPVKRIKRRTTANKDRDDFTDTELQKIFGPELAEAAQDRPERLFVPLAMLTTTARPNEIAQLHLEDIINEDGIPCIRIRGDEGDDGYQGKRRVKSASSVRTVPIPSALVGAGFLRYIDRRREETRNDPSAQVFAHLTKLDGRGMANKVVTFFGGATGFLERVGVRSAKKTLYSIRHTAITRLQEAGVDSIVRNDIEGHARQGTTGDKRYVKDTKIAAMLTALDRVDWTEALKNLKA